MSQRLGGTLNYDYREAAWEFGASRSADDPGAEVRLTVASREPAADR